MTRKCCLGLIAILSLITMGTICVAVLSVTETSEGPDVEFLLHDQVIEMVAGEPATFQLRMFNRGESTIEISGVKATCACTDVKPEDDRIDIGESVLLSGVLQPKSILGDFHHSLFVTTTDGRVFPALVNVRVRPRYTLTPERVILRPDIRRGVDGVADAVLRNETDSDVHFLAHALSAANVTVSCSRRHLAARETVAIRAHVDKTHVAPCRLSITLRTADENKRATVSALVEPVHQLTVQPSQLHLGVAEKQELLSSNGVNVCFGGDLQKDSILMEYSLPAYLKPNNELAPNQPLPAGVAFMFIDNFPGTLLDGSIEFTLLDQPSGRKYSVRVTIAGFLRNSLATLERKQE